MLFTSQLTQYPSVGTFQSNVVYSRWQCMVESERRLPQCIEPFSWWARCRCWFEVPSLTLKTSRRELCRNIMFVLGPWLSYAAFACLVGPVGSSACAAGPERVRWPCRQRVRPAVARGVRLFPLSAKVVRPELCLVQVTYGSHMQHSMPLVQTLQSWCAMYTRVCQFQFSPLRTAALVAHSVDSDVYECVVPGGRDWRVVRSMPVIVAHGFECLSL